MKHLLSLVLLVSVNVMAQSEPVGSGVYHWN